MTGVFLSIQRYDWCAPLSHPSSCMLVNHGRHNRAPQRNTSCGNEVVPQDTTHLIQRPCYQRGNPCQDQQVIGPHEDLLTIVKRRKLQWYGHVSRLSGLANTILQNTMKGGRRQGREEEVGRQHQGMDRPGVWQVPEGSGEQGKMEETGCEIVCGAPTTLAATG